MALPSFSHVCYFLAISFKCVCIGNILRVTTKFLIYQLYKIIVQEILRCFCSNSFTYIVASPYNRCKISIGAVT